VKSIWRWRRNGRSQRASAAEYLYYQYVPSDSAFTGIQKLPAGHLLEFERGEITIRQYWDLPRYNTHFPKAKKSV